MVKNMKKKSSIDEIVQEIISIVAKRLRINKEKISPDLPLYLLEIDSIKMVEIVYEIEIKYYLGYLNIEHLSKKNSIYDIARRIEIINN